LAVIVNLFLILTITAMKKTCYAVLASTFCLILIWFSAMPAAAQIAFGPQQVIAQTAVNNPQIIGAPDVNNDGLPDVIVLSGNGNRLSWFQNLGAGSFSAIQEIATLPNWALTARTEDYDANGNPDILVTYNQTDWLWLANDGNGNFAPPQPAPDATTPPGLLADLNGDGFADLVTKSEDASGFAIITYQPADGLGNYGASETIYTGLFIFTDMVNFQLADLNGDGFTDLLIADYDYAWGGNFTAWLNDGAANFTMQALPYTLTCGMTFAAADFNNDGAADLAIALYYNDAIYWKEQTAPFTFDTHPLITPILTYVTDAYIADVDNDGLPDVLSASGGNGGIAWHKNLSGGNFAPLQPLLDSGQNNDFCAEFSYQFNEHKIGYYGNLSGVGNPQLLYQHQTTANFMPDVLTNPNNVLSLGECWQNLQTADINNDGWLDVLTIGFFSEPSWYLNNGNGSFTFNGTLDFYSSNNLLADYNNDGFLDLLVSQGEQLYWATNDVTGNFTEPIPISLELIPLALTDLNNDGNIDIIGQLFVPPFSLVWLVGDGTGNFGTVNTIDNASYYYLSKMLPADLDNDGDTDLVVSDIETIGFFENLGEGVLGLKQVIAAQIPNLEAIRLADLDGDGDLDIVSVSSGDDVVAWYENISNNPNISGLVYYDVDQNGIYDGDDFGLNFQNITLTPGEVNIYTNANGTYTYFLPSTGSYSLLVNAPQGWVTTSPATLNITTTAGQNSPNNNFGLYPVSPISNLTTALTSGLNRCDYIVPYYLTIANLGAAIEAQTIVAFSPDPLLSFTGATLPPDSISADGVIYWHINNLQPYSNSLLIVYMQAPDFTATGAVLQNTLAATSYNSMGSPTATSSFTYTPIVTCAYDPNDKLVTPAGILDQQYTLMSEELFYTIRFQNTGNDTAFYVRITDVLSPFLDHNSFRIINSSHPMQTYRYDNGLVEFQFHNIMLPDSTTNPLGSQGFVQFAIKPLAGLPNNTSVNNNAAIYFDFNPPIITNTTLNTLVYELPTSPPLPVTLTRFTGAAQPNGNLLQWTTAAEVNNAYFTLQASPDGNSFTNLAQLPAAGNSSNAHNYQFLHAQPYPLTYYRLLQTDFDGSTRQIGEVITLQRTQPNGNLALTHISPNPTQNTATLTYTAPQAQPATLYLYDLTGRQVFEAPLQPTAGINYYELDMTRYPQGMYVVMLNNGAEVVTGKVVRE